MEDITIRPYLSGEASYVSYMQMKFYRETYNFTGVFEYYLLTSLAEFISSPDGGQLWVAIVGDEIIGSITIVKVDSFTAQLRWFIVDDRYQGKGIGKKLMDTAINFCREQGYRHIFLWTTEILKSARHLYGKYGFKCTEQQPNTGWTDGLLIEERWDLTL